MQLIKESVTLPPSFGVTAEAEEFRNDLSLRAREVLQTRTSQPRPTVALEARHVATVFRELAGERGSRSVPTPPTTMRMPSTKRVMEAAVAVANGEAGASNRLDVTAKQGVAHA